MIHILTPLNKFLQTVGLSILLTTTGYAGYPFNGTVLPPGNSNIVLGFAPDTNPVLTSACYAAVARWKAILAPYGVVLNLHPAGTFLYDKRGDIVLGPTSTNPVRAAETFQYLNYANYIYPSEPGNNNCFCAGQYTHHFVLRLNGNLGGDSTPENQYPASWEANYTWTYAVVLHELGHALGLEHPDWCGISTISVMNSRCKDLPSDLTAYDINNVQTLYAYHPYMASLWQNMAQAQTIKNATTRRNRIDAIHSSLNTVAYDRYMLNSLWPYLGNILGYGFPLDHQIIVPAMDGSP